MYLTAPKTSAAALTTAVPASTLRRIESFIVKALEWNKSCKEMEKYVEIEIGTEI
jgi:hypothetical protein